ncbi:Com family DNA-binding transcriptional regulator [Pseudomonas sp. MD195_PC81_125]|uniref:Com family DNA-binding transcriptional regulator n=1 Tax=Pseudomonas sp. MD195_PC81_125 TaxID=2741560 RepID=UPI0015FA143C|nr:Com family DNA-binding transcriptional regulator [Pseudomonas sp. MD195_PC81_125]MBA5982561.1 Com family DNA-binding transcriptional regulator [Pseudomonas sp. MD195_PC81_125]
MQDIRCGHCCRKLAAASGFTELQIKCPRCRTLNHLKAPSLPQACLEHPEQRVPECPNPPLEACSQA